MPGDGSARVVTATSGELTSGELNAAGRLVREAFGSDFRDHDWSHAVGGTHVLIIRGDSVVAHGAVVERILAHDSVQFGTGYVEAVAVRREFQGMGLGGVIMDRIESIIDAHYQLGALNAIEDAAPFYARRGWYEWRGGTCVSTATGVTATDAVGDRIFLRSVGSEAALKGRAPLICDWRVGDLW